MIKKIKLLFLFVVIVLFTGCLNSEKTSPEITEDEINKHEGAAITINAIDLTVETIVNKARQNPNPDEPQELYSFIVLKDGECIYEKYFLSKNEVYDLYSVSKSFVSTAVGIAVDEGLLSVEDKVSDFFPEYGYLFESDYKKQLKIKHLLSFSSGFEVADEKYMYTKDPMQYFFSLDIIHEPGTHFYYEGFNSFALSHIITKLTGMSVHDYLYEKLFRHLRIEDTFWYNNSASVSYGAFGLRMKAYDMAKIGQLYLDKGIWEGKRYISEEWIEQATKKQVETNDHPENIDPAAEWIDWQYGYGYNFWMCSFNAYRADGHNAQFIFVFPDENMVIVTTASILDSFIIPKAINDILLPNIK